MTDNMNNNEDANRTPNDKDDEEERTRKAKETMNVMRKFLKGIENQWVEYTDDVRKPEPEDEKPEPKPEPLPAFRNDVANSEHDKVKPVRRAKGIVGAFIDGISGREHVLSSDKSKNSGTVKTVLKTVVCIFSVIGVMAVVRAAVDAFKPRS